MQEYEIVINHRGIEMPLRKIPLAKDEIYHIYTRSIAGFKVFDDHIDYNRLIGAIKYYSLTTPPCRLSAFDDLLKLGKAPDTCNLKQLVKIIAYCVMPTHIHLVIQEIRDGGISNFMNLILKSYGKHYNSKHGRKGPLWEGPFKNVLVKTSEQLIHLTRYVHLNPVTAFIVNKPEEWPYSSYREYIGIKADNNICPPENRLDDMDVESYIKFVNDQIDYQRTLAVIKNLLLE